MRLGWHDISCDVVPTMKVIFKEHLARYYFEKVIICVCRGLYELSQLRESGRFLTDKALWRVATKRCIKNTTHSAFTMLLMCFTNMFQTQIR